MSKTDPRDWSDEQIEALLERLEEHVDTSTELGQAVKSRRRDVLKAIGAVGAGGLAGAAGMEAATGGARAGTQQSGTIGTPSNPVDVEAEDINSAAVTTDIGRIGTRAWSSTSATASEAAPLATDNDLDLYLDKTGGDDGNDGTSKANAVETVGRLCELIPKNIYHKVRVHINYADYSTQTPPGFKLFNHFIHPGSPDGLKIIGHDSSNDYFDSNKSVSDITFGKSTDSGCRGSEEFDVIAVTIDGRWQSYDSAIRFDSCVFKNGSGTTPVRLIDGHRIRSQYRDCSFESCEAVGVFAPVCQATFTGNTTTSGITDKGLVVRGGSFVFLSSNSSNVVSDPPNNSNIDLDGFVWGHPSGIKMNDDGTTRNLDDHLLEGRLKQSDDSLYHTVNVDGPKDHRLRDSGENLQLQRLLKPGDSGTPFLFRDSAYNAQFSIQADTGAFAVETTTDLSSTNGNRDGEMQRSDGTSGTAGAYYRWDDGNTQWVRVGDETETI